MAKRLIIPLLVILLVAGCQSVPAPTAERIMTTFTSVPTPTATAMMIQTPEVTATSALPLTTNQPSETRQIPTPTSEWNSYFHIAYIKDSIDPDYKDDNSMYIIDSNGQNRINVFEGISGIRGWEFSWSPSGNWLLFTEGNETFENEYVTLWIVRADGTRRRRLRTTRYLKSISWARDKDIFLINCGDRSADPEICIINPENGDTIWTGNYGTLPKFSPDGEKYAYIQNEKDILLANARNQNHDLLFSSSGKIPGYSWTKDNSSIITAVVYQPGCGTTKDGLTSINKIDVSTRIVTELRQLTWELWDFELSPTEDYALSSWLQCVGNVYQLDGVIGINNDVVTWPLANLVTHEWTQDGKYLIEDDLATGIRNFFDPVTGDFVQEF
jgi:hypothetical protein